MGIELMDVDNREVAMLGCGDGVDAEKKIKAVVSNEITGKLMIQSAREIPLSTCFGNLCCFDGSECYFAEWPEAVGTTFREVYYCFNGDGTESNSGKRPVELNPPGDYQVQPGDK